GSGDIEFSLSGVNKTTPGMIMGTVSYMSPEQAEGRETDPRTDIWSLGVMLYEMLAGKVPFKGPTSSHTIVAIIEKEPEAIEHTSPEMRQLISTALQKDRDLRFQTAAAMAAAIDDVKQRLGYVSDKNMSASSRVTEVMSGISTPAPLMARPSPFRKLFWIIPAAAVVLIVGVAAVYAIVGLLLDLGSPGVGNTVNSPLPTPTATVELVVTSPSPAPTEENVYVEPTPAPTPTRTAPTPDRSTPRPVTVQRTPVPKRTPRPTPRPTRDPNCVFTNTC